MTTRRFTAFANTHSPTEHELAQAKILWDYHCIGQLIAPSNQKRLILGLGSYDPRVAEYCAQLYLNGMGEQILFSGHSGNWTSGKSTATEAEIFTFIAIDYGVPENKIWQENQSTNLGENIQFSRQLLNTYHYKPEEIILVTKPNTTRRAYAAYMKYWPEMPVILSAPPIEINDRISGQTISDLINELVGDSERIITYPALGFQIHQEMPETVMQAWKELKQLGYNQHSPK